MNEYANIPQEKFQLASDKFVNHDKKLDTKSVGYFRDAWNRFKKNKASIAAAIIIILLVLFSVVSSIVSPYTVSYNDTYLRFVYPTSKLSLALGIDFWDGCKSTELPEQSFMHYYAMGVETGHLAVKNNKYTVKEGVGTKYYTFRLDSYHQTGVVYMDVTVDQYNDIQKYQNETGKQVIYPQTVVAKRPKDVQYSNDANFWYATKQESFVEETGKASKKKRTVPDLDADGNFQNIYIAYNGKDGYDSLRIEGETPEYNYAIVNQTGYNIRVNYYEYYIYNHTYVLKDGIKEPYFFFGTTNYGQDIFTCLGSGARLSFALAIVVSLVNLIVGAIYGAIEGYYGGVADLMMERFSDILNAVPFMIVITLLKFHFGANLSQLAILFIAFFLTGWIGMASMTRMQFYRFKNQEYVLAARTLGAKDARIMFKHIFPNSLGTLITSSVLVIPGMIFSESSLSYLGIINLSTGNMTSVGNMLADAQPFLSSYPHMILFPSLFISLLMLSFNLFGNGLRDAFNPSLRGSED